MAEDEFQALAVLADETTIETSVDGTVVRLVVRFLATGDET